MKKHLLLSVFASVYCVTAFAQQENMQAAKDANNPLASIKAVSFHNIYSPSLCGMDGTLNTTWLRYAQPFGRVLMRASMPINSINAGEINRSGLGDFTVFGAYILSKPGSHMQFGVGPLLAIPTASYSVLGTGKWQAGAAVVGYFDENPVFQCGFLSTWQHSFAGKSSRDEVHAATFQPFLMWQLGKGIYMRSTAISVFDFSNDKYQVPIGLGIGKVLKVRSAVCNFFAEPQFSVWNKGDGMPKTQIFVGVNTQF